MGDGTVREAFCVAVRKDQKWLSFLERAAPSVHSGGRKLIVIISRDEPGEVARALQEAGVGGKNVILIDHYSHKTERIIGVERDGQTLKCARDVLNLSIALNRALKMGSKSLQATIIADVLHGGIKDEDGLGDFVLKTIAKGAKLNLGLYIVLDAKARMPKGLRDILPQALSYEDAILRISEHSRAPVLGVHVCPSCGDFLGEGEECDCGGKAPAQPAAEAEMDLPTVCMKCGSLVSRDTLFCPNCGSDRSTEFSIILKRDRELMESPLPEISICTHCGAFVPAGAEGCPICGGTGRLEGLSPQLRNVLGKDVLESRPSTEISVCRFCGAFKAQPQEACPVCGMAEAADTETLGVLAQLDAVEGMLLELDVNVCSSCGAAIREGDRCPICGKSSERDELNILEEIARDGEEEARGREVMEMLLSAENPEPVAGDFEEGPPPLEHLASEEKASEAISDLQALIQEVGSPGESEPPFEAEAGRTNGDLLDIERARAPKKGPADGLTNGVRGRANGLTNGVRGRTNGLTNGVRGRTNGLTNGIRGRANGLVNGVRGRTNGLTGRTNGLTNGARGKVNGLRGKTNGLTNGLVNGMGASSGLTNGTGGGLTNGSVEGMDRAAQRAPSVGAIAYMFDNMGLVNGTGITDGVGALRMGRRTRTGGGRLKGAAMIVLFVATILIVIPLLSGLFVTGPAQGRFLGFDAWQRGGPSVYPAQDARPFRILAADAMANGGDLRLYVRTAGGIIAGTAEASANTTSAFYAFLDDDGNASTGYFVGGIGAERRVEIQGWRGKVEKATVSAFSRNALRDDWNGFAGADPVSANAEGSEMEMVMASQSTPQRAMVACCDGAGGWDIVPLPIANGADLIIAVERATVPDIVAPGTAQAQLSTLSLYAGSDGSSVSAIDVTGEGDLDAVWIEYPLGNGARARTTPQTPQGRPIAFQVPGLAIPSRQWLTVSVMCNASASPSDAPSGLQVSGLNATSPVQITRASGRRFFVSSAVPRLQIDGAFADWSDKGIVADSTGDVNAPSSGPVANANVDIEGVSAVFGQSSAWLYANVGGSMMGGSEFPTYLPRAGPSQPSGAVPIDSDRDGVPDSQDPMPYDFDNDGVPDNQTMGNHGGVTGLDVDGDGMTDYPRGTDYWLNATTPSSIPSQFAGRYVSIYIGAVSRAPMRGVDTATFYIDADGNASTGVPVEAGFGAEYALAIEGRGNIILSSSLFTSSSGPLPWAQAGAASAACDSDRLEAMASNIQLSPDARIALIMSDWQDECDTAIPAARPLNGGTRTPAGDNVVLNEISPRPNVEWIEVCNPTASPIDMSGWRLRAGGATVYTFPAGTTIGAWGSGSEYLVVNLPPNSLPNGGSTIRLQNRPTGIWTTVDQTTYPGGINGRTWSRLKNESLGMPTDTDNDANDWYISNNGWIVPEGPTPGAPNDRRRPVINVSKTAPVSQAEPGDYVNYTIWYNNTGDGSARNVWINDTLPSGMDYIGANVTPSSVSGQNVTWFFSTVVRNSVNSILVQARVNSSALNGTILPNVARLNYSDQLSRGMGNSTAWANATCIRPQIRLSKVANVTGAVAGGSITYTIYYNNTGWTSASDVWVNDTLPVGVTFVSSNPAPGSIQGLVIGWHFTVVAPGAHVIFVNVTVNGTTQSGNITNSALLNYTTSKGYLLEASNASATVVIPEFPVAAFPLAALLPPVVMVQRRKRNGGK
ncbi:MAG: DUF11 domain-containing protein [Euryarchaeota archaeon]|nr:DUF11 domain-containing protein [Euryarchaeota archaeon]